MQPPYPDTEIARGVLLRRPLESDLDELYAVVDANRTHLEPWMPWVHGTTRERQLEWIRSTDDQGLLLVADGAIAGTCGFARFDDGNRSASVGYWLAADAQGRGLVTVATRALLDYAFGPLELHRVELSAAVANVRSRAVAERIGFTFEGVLRQVERIGGDYVDHALYSMLADDWDRVRSPV